MSRHPELGQIVLYALTEADAAAVNARRSQAEANMAQIQAGQTGFIAHVGFPVNQGEQFPLMVTRLRPMPGGQRQMHVNGQVLLDGDDSLWVWGIGPGDGAGQWGWKDWGRPEIGQTVHYRSFGTPGGEYEPACRAAVVTAVGGTQANPPIDLCAINPTGLFFQQGVANDETVSSGGTWHWPERGW